MPSSARNFFAELVGTFALVFVGGGAIMMAQHTNSSAGLLSVAIAHGLALGLMVSATMQVSGGQLNPAISIGLMLTRRLPPVLGAIHIVAQLVGAALAAWTLKATFPAALVQASHAGGQAVALDVTTGHAIVLEAIATFFLMFVIYGTAVTGKAPRLAGLAIGLTIAADILAIGPLTGASMNPARSFGPALVSGVWEGHMIYWIGPIVGAAVAALLWEYVLIDKHAAT
ncbi:MAG: aquaporin [Gemmatimonadaceae bacterium]